MRADGRPLDALYGDVETARAAFARLAGCPGRTGGGGLLGRRPHRAGRRLAARGRRSPHRRGRLHLRREPLPRPRRPQGASRAAGADRRVRPPGHRARRGQLRAVRRRTDRRPALRSEAAREHGARTYVDVSQSMRLAADGGRRVRLHRRRRIQVAARAARGGLPRRAGGLRRADADPGGLGGRGEPLGQLLRTRHRTRPLRPALRPAPCTLLVQPACAAPSNSSRNSASTPSTPTTSPSPTASVRASPPSGTNRSPPPARRSSPSPDSDTARPT